MKTKWTIEKLDLRRQPHLITAEKIQTFKDYVTNSDNARLFLIIIRRRERELIGDGNKLEVKFI